MQRFYYQCLSRRMLAIYEAFETLRAFLPNAERPRRITRLETLQ